MSRVFANGLGRPGFNPRSSHIKMVLDATLLNIQHYKVRIKGKLEQSKERSSALLYTDGVVVIEKGAFRLPSTAIANFTLLLEVPVV